METVRLTPHSRLRRLVKTSRLRLTGVLQTLETRGTVRENSSLGVPAHICAVGLYFVGCPVHSVPAQPHKTTPQCRPKGSLSLTRMLSKNYFDSFSIKILFLSIALSNNVEYFKTSIYNQPSWRLNLPAIFFAGLIT